MAADSCRSIVWNLIYHFDIDCWYGTCYRTWRSDWFVDSGIFDKALDYSVSVVSDNLENFRDYFPSAGGVNGEYQPTDNAGKILGSDWTSSFWTGMIWLAYELTGEEKFKETGVALDEDDYTQVMFNDYLEKAEQQKEDIEPW